MNVNYFKYEDSCYEMLKYRDKIVVKEKKTSKYYETNQKNRLLNDINWELYSSKTSKKVYNLILVFTSVLIIINIYISFKPLAYLSNFMFFSFQLSIHYLMLYFMNLDIY